MAAGTPPVRISAGIALHSCDGPRAGTFVLDGSVICSQTSERVPNVVGEGFGGCNGCVCALCVLVVLARPGWALLLAGAGMSARPARSAGDCQTVPDLTGYSPHIACVSPGAFRNTSAQPDPIRLPNRVGRMHRRHAVLRKRAGLW